MLSWLFGRKPTTLHAPPLVPPPSLPVKDATEMLAEALAQLRKEMRSEESREYYEARDAQAGDDRRIAAATVWIEKAGLRDAIPKLVSTMWHYPAWMAKPGYAGHEVLSLVDLSAEKIEGDKVKSGFRVKWRMVEGGDRLALSFLENHSYGPIDGASFADASVTVNDDEVLRVSLIHDYEKEQEYFQWRTVTPSVLKPGEWVATILEVEHRIRLSEQRRQIASTSEYKRKQAEGLPPA